MRKLLFFIMMIISFTLLTGCNLDDFIAGDYDGNKTVIEELQTGEVFGTLTSSIKSEGISCITKEDTQNIICAAIAADWRLICLQSS